MYTTILLLNHIHTQYIQSGQGQYLNIKTDNIETLYEKS